MGKVGRKAGHRKGEGPQVWRKAEDKMAENPGNAAQQGRRKEHHAGKRANDTS